ncbi:MAG: NYN domain-containing protein [Bacteroidota bacterium]
MQHFIVDGYNVIHSIPSLRNLLLRDAEGAREQLIYAIARLSTTRKFRCTVVFDGAAPELHRPSPHAPIHVVYSFPISADDKIKELITKAINRTLLVVISSDREIINFAKVCSCQTHTSKHFVNLLHEDEDLSTEKSDSSLSPSQIAEWLKIFGEK